MINKKNLEIKRKKIYYEIFYLEKELNKYLNYCLFRKSCNFTSFDKLARKYVNRLEELTNQLHLINDILEDKITFLNVSIKFESFLVK